MNAEILLNAKIDIGERKDIDLDQTVILTLSFSKGKNLLLAVAATRSEGPRNQEQAMSTTTETSSNIASVSPDPAGVSLDQVRHVAHLANLELTAEELPRLAHDLNSILGHIAQLNELDTTQVPPMAQVSEILGLKPAAAGQTLRPDEIKASLDRAAVMAEAPDTDGRFFKVPKVIER
jgi:aspartyl-tRNA(Asn)/glutamyl-tRNA(Gln) amidotransferase subunit C